MATICVVNDDKRACTFLAYLLEDRGRDHVECCDSREAYNLLERDPVDLLILDLMTRNPADGWNLLTFLQLHPRLTLLPIVVCSAENEEILSREVWLRQRGIGVLWKPFDLDDLHRSVDDSLGRRIWASA